MRARGGRAIAGGGRPRRPMDWECGHIDGTQAAGTKTCKWLVLPSVLRDKYTDPTLMASMVWGVSSISGTGPVSAPVHGFGIIVVSAFDDADPLAAACPGPLTDCNADWVYLFYDTVSVAGASPFVNTGGPAGCDLDRRSSAKRRLGNDKGILLVSEAEEGGFLFHYHVRCLIKE